MNVYAYVLGNPVAYSDPRGLDNPSMGPYTPTINILQFINYVDNHELPHSGGVCATHIRMGLDAAGAMYGNTHPRSAKDWGPKITHRKSVT
jgi:hypothetical protein